MAPVKELTVPRQKSVPKRKKRIFCVSTLLTLLSFIIFIIILCTLLVPISSNKTLKKEFYLFKNIIIYKIFCFKNKFIIII